VKKAVTVITASIFLLVGCQTPEKSRAVKQGRQVIVERSQENRPPWIDNHEKYPGKRSDLEYFFGISGKFIVEQGARDNAYINAIKQVVHNVGVDVKIESKTVIIISQQASDVINPLIIGKEEETQIAEALISGSKALQWYWERGENYLGNDFMGSFWKAWVAVSIPINNLEEAKSQWAELQKMRRDQEKEKEIEKAKSLEDKAGDLISGLAENMEKSLNNAVVPVYIGNFKYGKTDCSSEFMAHFIGLLEAKAVTHPVVKVRGGMNINHVGPQPGLDLNSETDQAKVLNTNILHGSYSDLEKDVSVTAFITGESGRLSSTTIYIDKSKIKKQVEPPPGCNEGISIISALEPIPKFRDFDLLVWSEKGNSATYMKGEKFNIYFQSSERAYLKVFNIDQNGSVSVIVDSHEKRLLKNIKTNIRVKAEQEGVETVIAITSLTPFKDNYRVGEAIPSEKFSAVFTKLRNTNGRKAEYKTSFTIVQ